MVIELQHMPLILKKCQLEFTNIFAKICFRFTEMGYLYDVVCLQNKDNYSFSLQMVMVDHISTKGDLWY